MSSPQTSTEPHTPSRRRLRFSLRALLLLMTLVAVALGALITHRAWYSHQAAALSKLQVLQLARVTTFHDESKTFAGWFAPAGTANDLYTLEISTRDERIFDCLRQISCRQLYITAADFNDDDLLRLVAVVPKLETLVLRKSSVTNDGVKALRSLESLTKLSLGDLCIRPKPRNSATEKWYEFSADQFSDDALRIVADLPKLRELRLISKSVGDEQLAPFANVHGLEQLVVVSPKLSDACLANISKNSGLVALMLGGGEFSATGLEQLVPLAKLQLLALRASQIEKSGWPVIAQLPRLEFLLLEDTGATNEDLAAFSAAPKLWNLYLAGSELNDGLLKNLQAFSSLYHLHLYNTKVDDGGVQDLLALKHLNEIYISSRQFSIKARAQIKSQWPTLAVYDGAKPGDGPMLFFGPGLNRLEMNADYVEP